MDKIWPEYGQNMDKCGQNMDKIKIEFTLQWGSEILTSLDIECSKRGWVANGPDFEWDMKSGSPTILNLDKRPLFSQKNI